VGAQLLLTRNLSSLPVPAVRPNPVGVNSYFFFDFNCRSKIPTLSGLPTVISPQHQ
jgi:hypothetical protein